MAGDEEVELKLQVDDKDIDTLLQDVLVTGNGPASRDQRSTYYDTDDHDLRAAGISLRIRQSEDRRIQTIKAESRTTASLFARSEWERDVPADEPVLDDVSPVVDAALRGAGAAPQPVFAVEVNRTSMIHDGGASRIELVIDRGRILADDRASPIAEIELELLEGDRKALFALAHRISDRVPVRLGVQSKAERGYVLLDKEVASIKAEPIPLDRNIDAATLFEIIAGACIRQVRLNEDKLLVTGAPAALHQTRVGLRRLRSALSIFKPMLAGAELDRFQGDLRRLAALLGKVRDVDVMIEKIADQATLEQLHRARVIRYEAAMSALNSPEVRRLMLDFIEWVSVGTWQEEESVAELRAMPAPIFAASVLDRLRRRIKKKGTHLDKLDEEERHRVRIIGKKLRYAAEFFSGLYTEKKATRRREAFLAGIEDLQSALGHLNDLASGRTLFEELGIGNVDLAAIVGKMATPSGCWLRPWTRTSG